MADANSAVQVETVSAAPQRNAARLGRVLKPTKEKVAPRAWRGHLAANATASDYTLEDAGVTGEFVRSAIAALTSEEIERAAQRLDPLTEEEREKSLRLARFGQTAAAPSKTVIAGAPVVDELSAAKRLARFGAVPAEVPKQNTNAAKPNKPNNGKDTKQQKDKNKKEAHNEKQHQAKSAPKDSKSGKPTAIPVAQREARKAAVASILSNIVDDATKAAMATRAARFGAVAAS